MSEFLMRAASGWMCLCEGNKFLRERFRCLLEALDLLGVCEGHVPIQTAQVLSMTDAANEACLNEFPELCDPLKR